MFIRLFILIQKFNLENDLSAFTSFAVAIVNSQIKNSIRLLDFISSVVYCTNDLMIGIHWFATTSVMYELAGFFFPFHPSYAFMFHFTYIRTNLTSLSYVFGSVIETYITWGRI